MFSLKVGFYFVSVIIAPLFSVSVTHRDCQLRLGSRELYWEYGAGLKFERVAGSFADHLPGDLRVGTFGGR